MNMHDWLIVSVFFEWKQGKATINLEPFGTEDVSLSLYAEDVHKIEIPHIQDWGPSCSINEAIGPDNVSGQLERLRLEIQSGDVIEIVAKKFVLPDYK